MSIETGSPPDAADDAIASALPEAGDLAPVSGSSTLGVRKARQCLKCQTSFQSEWNGERLCRRCKSKSGWRHGIRGNGTR